MKKLFVLVALGLAGVANAQTNTVLGYQAANTEQYNANITVIGYQAMYACNYCYGTTAVGAGALRVSSGSYNTAIGLSSMYNATSGSSNTAIGYGSMYNLGSGYGNVAVGYNAGSCATVNGSYNVWIAHCGLAKDTNVIRIGTQGLQKFTQIAGIYNTKLPAGGGQFVMVNSKGQLGIVSTTLHTSSMPQAVSQLDIAALRTDLVATKNMVYQLQRDNAMLKAKLGIR
jgi:hypothetical protein